MPDDDTNKPSRDLQPLDAAPPLFYFAPRDDVVMKHRRKTQRASGAVLAGAAVFFSVFAYILGLLHVDNYRLTLRDKLSALVVPIGAILALGAITAFQHFVRGRRWFIQGVLIGLGIACLVEGACFLKKW